MISDLNDDKSCESMQRVMDEADCLFTYELVDKAITAVAKEITACLSDKNPILISVMNGGLVFSGMLLSRLSFPLQVDYLHVTRYRDETSGGRLDWLAKPNLDLNDRVVLIIDDILDEGHTLLAITNYCRAEGAKEVCTAVLIDKEHQRKAKPGLKADFKGLVVADRFVFGFGMDYRGYWRNAAGIYAVKGL